MGPVQPMTATATIVTDERAESAGADEERALDDRLMELVKGGDDTAFTRLVERHQHGLVAYLSRLTGSLDRAEDLAQEAFVRLYQSAARYKSQGRLVAYLYRIGTNLLRSEERRKKRWRLLVPKLLVTTPRTEEPVGEQRVLDGELHRHLRRELAVLPVAYRAPIVLAEVEGWSYAEIAELMGCRVGTIKSRVFRGRRRLREALTPYLEGSER